MIALSLIAVAEARYHATSGYCSRVALATAGIEPKCEFPNDPSRPIKVKPTWLVFE